MHVRNTITRCAQLRAMLCLIDTLRPSSAVWMQPAESPQVDNTATRAAMPPTSALAVVEAALHTLHLLCIDELALSCTPKPPSWVSHWIACPTCNAALLLLRITLTEPLLTLALAHSISNASCSMLLSVGRFRPARDCAFGARQALLPSRHDLEPPLGWLACSQPCRCSAPGSWELDAGISLCSPLDQWPSFTSKA